MPKVKEAIKVNSAWAHWGLTEEKKEARSSVVDLSKEVGEMQGLPEK